MGFLEDLRREKDVQEVSKELEPEGMLITGAALEILRDLKHRMERLEKKVDNLEKRIEEKIPENVLTEKKFKEELDTSEDIVNKIIAEVRTIAREKSVREIIKEKIGNEKPTIVEVKKMEKIRSILQEHEKLTSTQLSQIMDLSRTRCNEYFKQMENLGMVEPLIIGKEKYYKIINQTIQ